MVAVTRPLAQSIAEADDPQHWLQMLSERFTPQEMQRITEALAWAEQCYGERRYEVVAVRYL